MIVDKIENAKMYSPLHSKFELAFDYLRNTDFSNVTPGRHEVDGDEVFAMVNEYETKEIDEATRLEAHREYIDIQYMFSGVETLGITTKFDQEPTKEYDLKNDYLLYHEDFNSICLEQGMFSILFPDDLHVPGLLHLKSQRVKKVVVKVRL